MHITVLSSRVTSPTLSPTSSRQHSRSPSLSRAASPLSSTHGSLSPLKRPPLSPLKRPLLIRTESCSKVTVHGEHNRHFKHSFCRSAQWRIFRIILAVVLFITVLAYPLTRAALSDTRFCLPSRVQRYANNIASTDSNNNVDRPQRSTYDRASMINRLITSTSSSKGEAAKPSASIYLLTTRRRRTQLYRILEQLHTNFLTQYVYPVHIFHDDYTSEDESELRAFINQLQIASGIHWPLSLHATQLQLPSTIPSNSPMLDASTGCLGSPVGNDWPISYRHMCRWQSMLVQHEDVLQDYEYYLRLDDDSELPESMPYDIFQYMHQHKVQYGYALVDYEHHTCADGLQELLHDYIAEHVPHGLAEFEAWPSQAIAYNNFEVGSFAFWRSNVTQSMLQYVDDAQGIYRHRWGDAPIRTAVAIALLSGKNGAVHHFTDIAYRHGGLDSRDESIDVPSWKATLQQSICPST